MRRRDHPDQSRTRPDQDARADARGRRAYRVTLARGILGLTLGAAMVIQPEKTSDNLATYMGAFWTLTGVVGVRAALAGERTRGVPLVSGCIGIIAGMVVLLHARVGGVVSVSVLLGLLAIVVFLTGLAHLVSGFTTGDDLHRQRSRASILLGAMEMVLGLLLLLGSLENSRAAYWAAGLWAFAGGVILIGDAVLIRRQLRQ